MNGRSEINELRTAEAAGLESISLDYVSQNVCEHGNLLGEVSSAILQGRKVDAIDVSFRFKKIPDPALDTLVNAPIVSSMLAVSNSKGVETTENSPESFDDFVIYFSHLTDKSIDPQLSGARWFSNIESYGQFSPSLEYFPVNQVDLEKTVIPSTAASVLLSPLENTSVNIYFTELPTAMGCTML